MQAIQSIRTITGPCLTVDVPSAYQGKQVKIVITLVETPYSLANQTDWEETDTIFMEKPALSEELKKRLAENPDLLRGSVLYYEDPFGPACPPEDWEANS